MAETVLDSHRATLPGCTTCTYWISAENALQHAKRNIARVEKLLSRWRLRRGYDYAICAGFDEYLIRIGVDHREQVHVIILAENFGRPPKKMLVELGKIFSPFSSVLVVKSTTYPMPVFNEVDTGTSAVSPPRAIASDTYQQSNESSGVQFSRGQEKVSSESGNGSKINSCADPLIEESGKAENVVPLQLTVVSDICSQDRKTFFQTLTSRYALSFEIDRCQRDFVGCRVKFNTLAFTTEPTSTIDGTGYQQSHLKVLIDSHIKPAWADKYRPIQKPILRPLNSFVNDSTATVEETDNASDFSTYNEANAVRWEFQIGDFPSRRPGVELSREHLPEVAFELRGYSPDETPPGEVEIGIGSCWTLGRRGIRGRNKLLEDLCPHEIICSNILQISTIKVPFHSPEPSDFSAFQHVVVGQDVHRSMSPQSRNPFRPATVTFQENLSKFAQMFKSFPEKLWTAGLQKLKPCVSPSANEHGL